MPARPDSTAARKGRTRPRRRRNLSLIHIWERAAETAVDLKRVYPECCAAQSVDVGVKFL